MVLKSGLFKILVLLLIGFSACGQKNIEPVSYYKELNLEGKLDYTVFKIAIDGFNKTNEKTNRSILTIIDFTKPSTENRLFVLDLKNKKVLYHTLVAHGKNSGENYAKSFSNTAKSLKSSLGFYVTAETYMGKHGYSLKLDGLEQGLNSNARERAIVVHGAAYVSAAFCKKHGRLGRSWGCPALPLDQSKEIIDVIKDGSCFFIYGKSYLQENNMLR